MASPMAKHWRSGGVAQVLRVLDRGHTGERRDRCRKAWCEHGAELVHNLPALVGQGDLDGVFVCCGKNGDDLSIIAKLAAMLSRLPGRPRFICHMSTVSVGFVAAATTFCRQRGVAYVNYPLTGGPSGAEKGNLLILTSGERSVYTQIEPALLRLGTPKYFGESPQAAPEVKFIGHLMVFNGLLGICAAVAAHSECFRQGAIGGVEQSSFFDFLNGGAGGTRQWDVILSNGVRHDIWDAPFSLRYGAVDAIYTAQLCLERGLSCLAIEPVLKVALAFSYVMNSVDENLATHSIVREMLASRASGLDAFIRQHFDATSSPQAALERCTASLPFEVRRSVSLIVGMPDFEKELDA